MLQVGLDGRQRDVHDRRVEDDHELREADEAEDEPGVRLAGGHWRSSAAGLRSGSSSAAKARRNWIQEERRKTLGDYTCFCLACGSVWRYFLEVRPICRPPAPLRRRDRHRCPECSAPFPSAFAVECEECGAAVRPSEVLGIRIRKPGR